MRIFFSLLLFSINLGFVFSQTEVSGRVVDIESGQPLEYVHVFVPEQRLGTLTDSLGNFQLITKEGSNDTIVVSMIGYETRHVLLSSKSMEIALILSNQNLPLLDFESGNIRDTIVGFTNEIIDPSRIHGYIMGFGRGNGAFMNNLGAQVGIKCELPKATSYLKIERVRFYLPDVGNPKTPFRLNIFTIDTLNNNPGNSLLKKNLICKSNSGDRWYEVDISDLNIYSDSNVIFITMEWLGLSKRGYWTKRNLKRKKKISDELKLRHKSEMFGQVLGMYGNQESVVCSYNHFDGWRINNFNRTPMIQVKVDYAQ